MTILALESSARAASVAVCRDEFLLAQSFQNRGLTHSETLLPMVSSTLHDAGMELAEVELIAVTHGPGSFTGLRIGVASAAGLSWADKLPCVGVSSLKACAEGVAFRGGLICAVMDARRSEVYNALFLAEDGRLTRLTEDRALAIEALEEELLGITSRDGADAARPPLLVGDGAPLCFETMRRVNAELAPPHLRYPQAASVAALALMSARAGQTMEARDLQPKYLRVSQAERERLSSSKNCGF